MSRLLRTEQSNERPCVEQNDSGHQSIPAEIIHELGVRRKPARRALDAANEITCEIERGDEVLVATAGSVDVAGNRLARKLRLAHTASDGSTMQLAFQLFRELERQHAHVNTFMEAVGGSSAREVRVPVSQSI